MANLEEDAPGDRHEAKSGPPPSKKKPSGLYKPPTHEELQSLKETESLFRSNLIKLQVREEKKEKNDDGAWPVIKISYHLIVIIFLLFNYYYFC